MEMGPVPKIDLFSNLPSNITEAILVRLPIQDAVRTSILSRDWRYKWITIPEVVFDQRCMLPFSSSEPRDQVKRVNIIDQVLLRHKAPIDKFSCSYFLESCSDLDRWILFLSSHGVKVLILNISGSVCYKLPSRLFSCPLLNHLELHYCILAPSLTNHSLPNLRSLNLKNVTLVQDMFELFISKCSVLERITLSDCNGIYDFKINVRSLQYLTISGVFDSLSLENGTLLEAVFIDANMRGHASSKFSTFINFHHGETNIRSLVLLGYTFEFLASGSVRNRLPSILDHLNYLSADICLASSGEVWALLSLLRRSPNLENLEIHATSDGAVDDTSPVESLWEAEDLDLLLKKLKNLKMFNIFGIESELEFIKFILANAPVLERIGVEIAQQQASEETRIFIELMGFRRTSSRAEIIYLGLSKFS